jgi:hypothetical protein
MRTGPCRAAVANRERWLAHCSLNVTLGMDANMAVGTGAGRCHGSVITAVRDCAGRRAAIVLHHLVDLPVEQVAAETG